VPLDAAENIYRAAIRLFGERGYPSTSMRDISSAVGVLPGSLYTHITSKQALLLQIVENGIQKYLDAVRPLATTAEPADIRLREAIKAHVKVAGDNIQLSLVTFHQWKHLDDETRRRVVGLRNTYQAYFSRIIEDGIEAGILRPMVHPSLAVLAVLGMLNWVPEWFSPSGPATADEVGDHLADVILEGLLEVRPPAAPIDDAAAAANA